MSKRPCPICTEPSMDGHICHACTRTNKGYLRDLPWLYARLDETVGRRDNVHAAGAGQGHADEDAVRAATERRYRERVEALRYAEVNLSHGGHLPYRPDAADLQETVRNSLVGWVRVGCEDWGQAPPEDRITAICGWLRDRAHLWRKHEAGGEYMREVAELTRAILSAINPPASWRYPAGPCPEHDEGGEPCPGTVIAKVPREGSDKPPLMRCDTCTTEWDTTQWNRAGRRIQARREQIERQREYGRKTA